MKETLAGPIGPPSLVASTALEASRIVKATSGAILSLTVYNSGPDQFIQVHAAAALPANGAVPVLIFPIPSGATIAFDLGVIGVPVAPGIVACNSTTAAAKTIGAADCFFTAVIR